MNNDSLKVMVIILTTVILKNACGDSEPKGSAVFVIDKTKSMDTVIRAVKSGANAIFDTVARSDESPVENFILVTFGDPNISDALITTNHDEFKKALSSISLESGNDCPELSMSGIEKALESSLPGSYLYVFTDASAKDFDKFENVKRIAQAKDCQVVFILTGKCGKSSKDKKTTSTIDDVYLKLASATSGQVFNLLKQDIAKILRYVKDSIRSRRVILHTGTYSPGKHRVTFTPDTRTKDMTIAISGSYPEATVKGPDGETIDADVLVSLNEILIVKVDETKPGAHSVNVSSEEPAYVVISAKSDVKFRHGFSTTLPSTLNDTVFKPVSGGKNYLSIKLYGENVQLTSAKFLTPNYHTILEMPLRFDEKQEIYVTNLISPPKTPFRIAVKGIDKKTNTSITRFGTMIIESDKFVNKNPTVHIEGDNKVIVEYDGSLKLRCKVNAYPEPRVIWRDLKKGTFIPATDSVREPPYNFISILELENVNENSIYECFAVNKLGIGKYSVKVEVKHKPYFKILEKPMDTEVDYNEQAVLHCKVDAFPPAKVTWFSYPKKRLFSKRDKVEISPDGSMMTIKHMKPSLSGTIYVCKAENDNKTIFPRATVTISAKMPKINKTSTETRVKEGETAHLNCSLLEGKPKPEIKWYRKPALDPSAKYMEVEEARNQTIISLRNVNRFDTAIYKCRAGNVMGMDIHTMDLFVECPPTIKDDIKFIVAKEGEEVNMTCTVQGIPTPTREDVVWLKDGEPLGSEIKRFRDHSLKFIVDLHHMGKYTCTAKNKLGSAQRTVQVLVYSLHLDPPLKSKIQVRKHRKTSMKCSAEGEPEPTLEWIFFSFDKTVPPKTLSSKGSKLTLSNIKENQRGYYTCVASNIGGSQNITYEIDVMFPPEIQSDLKPKYRAVDGDRVLKVHCRATGNPKPVISWQKDGMPLAAGDRYIIEDDWLVIKNVKKSDTAGDYYCEAKNKFLGKSYFDTGTFKIIVDRYPSAKLIKSTTTVLIREGEIYAIECFVPHSDVDTIIWYKDGAKFYEGKLILDKAKLSDSGVYTCRVNYQDLPTIETANTKVIVGSKPEFVTEEETTVEFGYGQFGFLNCKVLGEPAPTVTWWHNRASIKFSEMVYNFEMDTETAGKYTCEVTNEFGSASRTFDVTLKGCFFKSDVGSKTQPLMVTTSGTWPNFIIIDGYAIIPKNYNVMFSCPSHFTKFEQSDIKAQCDRGTKFNVDGALIDYTDIQCKSEVESHVSRKRKQCYGKDTNTVKSVFNLNHKTIEVFEVCVDGHGNPIYAKHNMRSPAGYISKDPSFSDESKLGGLYSCRNQDYTFSRILRKKFLDEPGCCFSKRHLVNPKDVFPGPSQRATFSSLNVVPHWSSCHGENWDELEEKVRKLAQTINNNLIIYTGTAGYLSLPNRYGKNKRLYLSQKTHQPISTYLWKVIQCPTYRSSIAIIQLNIPKVTSLEVKGHRLCRDICEDIPWMRGPDWRSVERGYTYCCELKDFEFAFKYRGVFEPYLTQVLNIAI